MPVRKKGERASRSVIETVTGGDPVSGGVGLHGYYTHTFSRFGFDALLHTTEPKAK